MVYLQLRSVSMQVRIPVCRGSLAITKPGFGPSCRTYPTVRMLALGLCVLRMSRLAELVAYGHGARKCSYYMYVTPATVYERVTRIHCSPDVILMGYLAVLGGLPSLPLGVVAYWF